MKGKNEELIITILFIIGIIIIGILLVRVGIVYNQYDIPNENLRCVLENGENWSYDYDNYGFCIKRDYITLNPIDRTPINLSNEYIENKYCPNRTIYFDLSKWNSGCK
jgi:hypothetical protein